jgi:hypothetical protein
MVIIMIIDKVIRKQIAITLKQIQKYMKDITDKEIKLTLRDLDNIGKSVIERHNNSKKKINQYMKSEISLSFLGIVCIAHFSLAINQKEDSSRPLPSSWIKSEQQPDPNYIISNLLVHVTNHSLAILKLVCNGLDPSARVLLRVLNELSWLTIILSADRDKIVLYYKAFQDGEEENVWYKHFRLKNLNKNLSDIEKKLGLDVDQELLKILKENREKAYKFYSKYLHNCYSNIMIQSYAQSFENEEHLDFALFGKETVWSLDTLNNLNWILFYLIGILIPLFKTMHNFIPPVDNELWRHTVYLRHLFTEIYLYVIQLHERNGLFLDQASVHSSKKS